MAITFYWGSGSPPSWRVALALEHKTLPYESRLLSFSGGEHKSKEFLAVNPRGKVPAIVDDGFALWESSAIVEYLDQRYPGRFQRRSVDGKSRHIRRSRSLQQALHRPRR